MEEIRYFISFVFTDKEGRTGFGNIEHNRLTSIWDTTTLQDVTDSILKDNEKFESIVILNWKRFED